MKAPFNGCEPQELPEKKIVVTQYDKGCLPNQYKPYH